jgi:hypothetical protein
MATYEMRAMSVGEILDGAFALYRDLFGTLVSIAIVCQGIPTILAVYISLGGGNFEHLVLSLVVLLASGIGGLVATGATLWAISEAYLGAEPTAWEALEFALGKVVGLLVAGMAKYILMIIGLVFFVIPGIVVACGYAVVAQAVVLEEHPSATDALGRSWTLTKGLKGKAFVLGLVVWVLLYLPFVAGEALATFVPGVRSVMDVGAQLLWLMVYPLIPCVFTLFYYDLRVRREAFDLEHLSRQIGLAPSAA